MAQAIKMLLGRPVGVAVGSLAVATVIAGCGGQGAGPSTSANEHTPSTAPGASSSANSKPPSNAEMAGLLASTAYLGMWQDMAKAATTSDWESPALAHHATGEALSTISRGLYADHLNGLVAKGQPTDHPIVKSVDPPAAPTTVMISDCGDSTHWLQYHKDSGKLADNDPGGRQSISAEVKKQSDGTWRVTRFAVEAVGSC